VIAYAACIGDPDKFRRICLPGVQRVAKPEDVLIEAEHEHSIFAAYNEVLDAVREIDDLEAVVLLHEDTEITDPDFADLIRRHVADDDVAVVGAVGARDISGLAWWEGTCFGRVHETRGLVDFGGGTHDVDTVDGLVMALSPWAVRTLRFDEDRYNGFDAYDADFCAEARAAGKRVVVTELPVAHRHSRVGTERASSDGGSFERNDRVFKAKWLGGAAATGVRDEAGDEAYFEHARPELSALVPPHARRILDVGCGGGALGAALKAEQPGRVVIGLEGFPEAAARARARLDDAICLDLDNVDELPSGLGSFDAIIFGDVLEHLRDPIPLVRTMLAALAEDGVLVCSIPNVKHWTVLHPLLVRDRWTYEDAGLLDRTHVHFFTAHSIERMLRELRLELVQIGINDHAPLPPKMSPLADLAAQLGADRAEAAGRLGAYQYLLVARRSPKPAAPGLPAPGEQPGRFSDAAVRAAVPTEAERVLDVAKDLGPELDAIEAVDGSYDAIVLHRVLEHVRDPQRLLRTLMPALARGGAVVAAVPNVKHWSIVQPLLVDDRWCADPRQLRHFTLDELADLLEDAGLEGVEVVANEAQPLPAQLEPLVEAASRYGADAAETRLRLGASEYLLVARRAHG
jgi:2-polyprenyl-3-methyl-5-hydroxy-6-metoxy-1,4-benzoquinol methylase